MHYRCRKNQALLTAAEKSRFVNAVLALKANGVYNTFVQNHINAMTSAHRGSAFLPWHREFLNRFELELRKIDAQVTLPYWDWTVDNSGASSIWNADFMGGNGRPADGVVTTGPFAFSTGNWPLAFDGPRLRRQFGVSIGSLPTPADVANAMAESVYDVAPWNASASSGFRNRLEGWINGPQLHNRAHVWVGGSMLPMSSPNDPVFFLHHCFIDKLWADWQRTHPGVAYPAVGPAVGHRLNDPMSPFSKPGAPVRPADTLDHHAMGYAYDTEGLCFHIPKLKFIDDGGKLKFKDDQPKLKFKDDKLKFTDDPQQSLKFRDDVKLPALDQGKLPAFDQVNDPLGNVSNPGVLRGVSTGVAPFVLSTPHHSNAWVGASQQAQVQQLEQAMNEIAAILQQAQQAQQAQGPLGEAQQAQLQNLDQQLQSLDLEWRKLQGLA